MRPVVDAGMKALGDGLLAFLASPGWDACGCVSVCVLSVKAARDSGGFLYLLLLEWFSQTRCTAAVSSALVPASIQGYSIRHSLTCAAVAAACPVAAPMMLTWSSSSPPRPQAD
jgi:hypothetical protein